jgi:hypothetical protein
MEPLITISLLGLAFVLGATLGYLIKSYTTVAGVTIDDYDCATNLITVTTTSAMNLFIDALDDTAGTATQPDFPGPNAVAVPANGHVSLGPLSPPPGVDKLLLCIWAVEKIINKPHDCAGSGSGSVIVLKKARLKSSVLP